MFPGTSEYNQIFKIVDMLGPPPRHMIEVGKIHSISLKESQHHHHHHQQQQ